MPFSFKRLEIPDVVLIEPKVFRDDRGFFLESYKRSEFAEFGIDEIFVQDNHSRSRRGVLRGLHYQNPPRAQAKLVRVIDGEIFDVAVDIRRGSPTYGRWVRAYLSDENMRMLYIPAGFAHGFLALSDVAEVLYKTSDEYSPEHEAGIVWNDPEIGIEWPVKDPVLSPRDCRWPGLRDAVNAFVYGGVL
ncbi:MAG: dTDP-4-dehydrorhamnose 3,5-epimerase [Firmicutes bacterium]|nr:dTDP-4-dehydrorhamnose 3,5-epimerase [Bacillota bacterium]